MCVGGFPCSITTFKSSICIIFATYRVLQSSCYNRLEVATRKSAYNGHAVTVQVLSMSQSCPSQSHVVSEKVTYYV